MNHDESEVTKIDYEIVKMETRVRALQNGPAGERKKKAEKKKMITNRTVVQSRDAPCSDTVSTTPYTHAHALAHP